MKRLLLLYFTLAGWGGLSAAAVPKPNILVIIADDLGYGDVSCNGTSAVQTPNIDKLATEGRRFRSGYCSASTCTPTRYSLMTGTYAFRVKGTGVAPPNAEALIQPGTETVASLLQRAGYATAAIGKWHLGLGKGKPDWNGELNPGPLEIGFDHCLLLPTTNDRVPQVFVQDHRVRGLDPADPLWVGDSKLDIDNQPTGLTDRASLKMDWSLGHNGTIHNGISRIGFYTGGMKARFRDQDLADEWVKESKQWLEAHKERPFFLYFAAHDIHVPRAPHERFAGKSGMGPRGDSILEFDWCVGELMQTLDRLGIAEKTLVVLCSDNGPVLDDGYKDGAVEKLGKHQPSGIFRGGKYSIFEGGTRVPFITRWKGRIQPAVSDDVVCTVDFPATFAALAGEKVPAGACLDSFNVLGALLGEAGAKGRDHLVQQDNNANSIALREGSWKLVRQKPGPRMVKDAKDTGKAVPAASEQLYDLAQDAGEQANVAAQHPEELQRLRARLDKVIADGKSRAE